MTRRAAWVTTLTVLVLGGLRVTPAGADVLTETEIKKLAAVPARDTRDLTLSPDGERIAYVLTRANQRVVVIDGKEQGEPCDDVRGLAFSPGAKYAAWAGCREGVWFPAVNGKEGERYTSVCGPVFSADEKHFAFAASRGHGRCYVIQDGVQQIQYAAVGSEPPVFSPDSRRLAWEARSSGTAARIDVRNPDRTAPPNEPPPDWVTDDGKEVDLNSASIPRTHFIVLDDRKGIRTTDIKHPVFSPNSRTLVYAAAFADKWFLVCDDRKVGRIFEDLGRPVFSANSRSLAYPAKWEGKWLVVEGKKKHDPFDGVAHLTFSPDSKRLAYAAETARKWRLVCEGRKSGEFDGIEGIVFSRDSRHVAWIVRRGMRRQLLIDGVEGAAHARVIFPDEAVTKKDRLRCVVIDGEDASLVEVDWPADTTWENAVK